MTTRSLLARIVFWMAVGTAAGCVRGGDRDAGALTTARARAGATDDGETVGILELLEMYAPGGSADRATALGKRLDGLAHEGMWASLAQAIDDEAHGAPIASASAYVRALAAASRSADTRAPLVGWFAVRHLIGLRGSVSQLYHQYKPVLERVLVQPGRIGWRAVAELQDWRALELYDRAELSVDAYDDDVVRRMGCARAIRLAGPFGHGSATDALRSFPAESIEPWPRSWAADPIRGTVPHLLTVVQKRCMAVADEQVQDGVFYVETFFSTGSARDVLIAVQGADTIWVDGTKVLSRSVREWGSWQRFGTHVLVGEGRHRILARTLTAGASVRLLNPDGTSANLTADSDPRPAVTLAPPLLLSDPNPLDPIVRELVSGNWSSPSPIDAMLAAYAAHTDQQDDVASALLEPLVHPADAAALALDMASSFASSDPGLPEDVRNSKSRSLRDRALARDPGLWRLHAAAIMNGAEEHGLTEAIDPLRELVRRTSGQPELLEQLSQLYGRLGWKGEELRTLETLSTRFPDDASALRSYLEVLDDVGSPAEAEGVAKRLRQLDPDSEVDLDRALARHDYRTASAELARLKMRHPERKDIASRMADVLARAGEPNAADDAVRHDLAKHPQDAEARFRLADHTLAQGDAGALRRALASALESKSDTDTLRNAIDLVEGVTDLEPYRRDGRSVIADFQTWEKAGHHMDGTAARVLDYAAIWVNEDGSSEMLEHEIQKIQSQEAVTSESETEPPAGLVLHLQVIKSDGTVLEPEPIAGKRTLTLPNLEVGDFVESEHITVQPSDGAGGRRFESPLWFFREADKGYWRSEFVVVTPGDRKLDIESHGNVPPAETKTLGAFVERRWRVELSPPAELEPDSPAITEFLPSVRLGWGVSMATALPRFVDLADDATPLDPRLRRLALEIVDGVPPEAQDERSKLLYRWVLAHVEDGKETDGRRALFGRNGSRQAAFRYMLRLVGIASDLAIVKDRLAAPPSGDMSEIDAYDALAIRVATERGPRWLTVHDKFAPYGYVPAELHDQRAIVLRQGTPSAIVQAPTVADDLIYEGRADVRSDGSAVLDLTITFEGTRAMAWRGALEQIPEAKLNTFVERELVGPALDGAHVRELKSESAADPDKPLVMHLLVDVPELAKPTKGQLVLRPPFCPSLSQLATLPVRRTALMRRAAWRLDVRLRVDMPASTHVLSVPPSGERRDGDAVVTVRDLAKGHTIQFDRTIDLPAARIEPGEPYAAWATFVREADALASREVIVGQ